MKRLEREWRASKLEIDRQTYIAAKRSYHGAVVLARRSHFKDSLDRVSSKPRLRWRVLNQSFGRSQVPSAPAHIDPSVLACDFNNFFLSKPLHLHSVLLNSPHRATIDLNREEPSKFFTQHVLSTFCSITPAELSHILKFSPRNTCSLDPLPTRLLCDYIPSFFLSILTSMNLVLRDGMPIVLKQSVIIPRLKKKGADINELCNYRPVSNLPFISKVIERAVAFQLVLQMESHRLFDPHQFAYRHDHFCETAILFVMNEAYTAMNNRQVTVRRRRFTTRMDGLLRH